MEEIIVKQIDPDSRLAHALRANREHFNALFAQAKSAKHSLDIADFKRLLTELLAPIIDACDSSQPIDEIVDCLFTTSLQLYSRDLIGARSRCPYIERAWEVLLPRGAHLLCAAPQSTLSAITNPVYNIWQLSARSCESWIQQAQRVIEQCSTVAQFKEVGKVIAWRNGMAHFRDGALQALSNLPPNLGLQALGIAQTTTEDLETTAFQKIVRSLEADKWYQPAGENNSPQELRVVAMVGDFEGFGGQFKQAPRVFERENSLYAIDGENCFLITADAFGALLHRDSSNVIPPEEKALENKKSFLQIVKETVVKESEKERFQFILKDGLLRSELGELRLPMLRSARSIALTDDTFAITLMNSHRIYIAARSKFKQVKA